jgi:hypothetical protein
MLHYKGTRNSDWAQGGAISYLPSPGRGSPDVPRKVDMELVRLALRAKGDRISPLPALVTRSTIDALATSLTHGSWFTELSFGATELPFGLTELSFGATELSIDPTELPFGPTGQSFGPTELSFGPTKLFFGPSTLSFGSTEVSFASIELSFGPTGLPFGPTELSLAPTVERRGLSSYFCIERGVFAEFGQTECSMRALSYQCRLQRRLYI